MTRRFVETWVMPVIWLAVIGSMLWGCVQLIPTTEELELFEQAARSDFGRTSRPDHATSPAWQPVSVVDGACRDIVSPSEP